MGKIYNIPLSNDFLENLAQFIAQKFSTETEPNFRVFLPNKLSCFAFHQKIDRILKIKCYSKRFFPKIYSISDELSVDKQKISAFVMPILLKNRDFSGNSIDILYSLAESIAEVVQNFILNDVDFSKIHFHLPENLQDYWSHYRTILDEVLKNPEVDQYIRSCKIKLQIFINSLTNDQVIAAGINVPNYYTLKFLKKILDSQKGIIVFQGLELKNSENYFATQKILQQLNASEKHVANLIEEISVACDFINFDKNSEFEIQSAEFNNLFQEASAISAAIQRSVSKKQSVIVISNDVLLTEKILSQLKNLNINLCDHQEKELSNSNRILFSALLNLFENKFTTKDSLKFLKMFPKFRSYIEEMEFTLRKTESIYGNFSDAFKFWTESVGAIDDCKNFSKNCELSYREFCIGVEQLISFYSERFQGIIKYTFSDWLNNCVHFLEIIDSELSLKFKEIIESVSKKFAHFHAITFDEFSALCKNYMINKYIKNFYVCDHNIIIANAQNAQLLDADLVVITGANTENWNAAEDNDVWMTRQILYQFSRNFSHQNEEQMKCIFERFLQKKKVLITRAKVVGGEQQLPVKFLEKILNGKRVEEAEWLKKIVVYERIAQDPIRIQFAPPRPSVNLRPQNFSATGIKLLHDNPYNFYAKYILKLRELSQLNEIKNARGNFIHKVLEDFVKNSDDKNNLKKLIYTSQKILQKMHLNESDFGLWFFRLPRLLKFVTRNLDNNKKSFTEIDGKINFEIAPEKFVCLNSKADRIDVDEHGKIAIVDYKTGAVPSAKEVKNFDAPQLLIEGLIYLKNGFPILIMREKKVDSLSLWALNEPERGGEIKIISDDYREIESLTETTSNELKKMLIEYNLNGIAYVYNPKYKFDKSYAHLARKKEWSDA